MKQVSGSELRGEWVEDPEAEHGELKYVRAQRNELVEAHLQIRPQFVPEFLARVEKFRKIAARHGQEVSARFIERIQIDHPVFGRKRKQLRDLYAVMIPPMVGVKGRIIGHFDKAESGSDQYVHVFSEADRAAVEALVPRAGQCDHCHKKRQRVKSFVVEHEGAVKIVGKNCLMDYLGIDPAYAIAAAEWFEAAEDKGEREDWGGRRGGKYVDLMPLVEAAFKVARKHGGYPGGEDRYWFRNHVSVVCYGGVGKEAAQIKAEYEGFDPGPLDAQALADYVEKASGDFGSNLRLAMEQDMIHVKRSALVIAGVAMWVGRSLKRKVEAEKAAKLPDPKRFAEAVGSRVNFEAEVVRAIPRSGEWGMSLIIGLRCADGRQAVIFHSGRDKPQAGKRYAVRASIKRHQAAFRGIGEESVLSRAKFEEIAGQAQAADQRDWSY